MKKETKNNKREELDNRPTEPGSKIVVVYLDASLKSKKLLRPSNKFVGNIGELVREMHPEHHSYKVL